MIDGAHISTTDQNTVLNDFYGLTSNSDTLSAMQQMSGDAHTVSPVAAFRGQQAVMTMVDDRNASIRRDGGVSGTNFNFADLANISSSEKATIFSAVADNINSSQLGKSTFSSSSVWMRTIAQGGFAGADSNGLALNTSSVGAVFGADYSLDQNRAIGGALSLVNNTAAGGSQILSTGLTIYGTKTFAPYYVSGRLSGSYDEYSNSRSISFSTLSRKASSSAAGYQMTSGIEFGKQFKINETSLEAYSGVNAGYVYRNGFTESGADALDVTVSSYNANTFNTTLGTRISSNFSFVEHSVLTPFAQIAWQHDFAAVLGTTNSTLFNSAYTLSGPDIGADSLRVGLGLSGSLGSSGRIFANYNGSFRTRETDHGLEVGMTYNW